MDYFAKYINTHHSNWREFDKHFVQYSLGIIQDGRELEVSRLEKHFEEKMRQSHSNVNLGEIVGEKVGRLTIGFEWIKDTIHYITERPEPARDEHVSALDFFLMVPHPSLSLDCDRNSFLDLLSEKLKAKESFPWKEIEDKVKSDIDKKNIRDAYYWASLCYKQFVNQKGE